MADEPGRDGHAAPIPVRNLFAFKDAKGWGYFNRRLVTAIQPRFRSAEDFFEAHALAVTGNDIGIINEAGQFVTMPEYSEAWRNSCGRLRVSWRIESEGLEHVRYSFVDTAGKRVSKISFDRARDFSEGLAAVKRVHVVNGVRTELWGFVGLDLESAFDSQFADVGDFSCGLAAVRIGLDWGYINSNGALVIQPQFRSAGAFSGGLAVVSKQGAMMYINLKGEVAIPGPYTVALQFSEGVAAVATDVRDGYFYIDSRGRPLFFGTFRIAGPFSDGVARVFDGQKWGYINKGGKLVVPSLYEEAFDFVGGLAVVREGDEYWYIDRTNVKVRKRS